MRLLSSAFDLLFQKACLVCSSFSTQDICHRCLLQKPAIVSLSSQLYPETLGKIKVLTNIFSIYKYEANARDLCLAMKNRPSPRLIKFAAKLSADKLSALFVLHKWDYLVPIPASTEGHRTRGYNHMLLFCQTLAANLYPIKPVVAEMLSANCKRAAQSSLSRSTRKKGLFNRFTIKNSYSKILTSKKILLVDDILTTGSTLAAAAFALQRVQVRSIDTFSLCFTQGEFSSSLV